MDKVKKHLNVQLLLYAALENVCKKVHKNTLNL